MTAGATTLAAALFVAGLLFAALSGLLLGFPTGIDLADRPSEGETERLSTPTELSTATVIAAARSRT